MRCIDGSDPGRSRSNLLNSFGVGVATGAAAAFAALVGRKVLTAAKVGKGHPLKHRLLDLASAAVQRKYPVEAMSTYLNGFHMYADEHGPAGRGDALLHPPAATTCTSA